ncbi:MAG: xylosidase/arabinosidase [Pirellulaceae bacterium]|nr:xylosidase/arabinosidase [Pirellulaceae bacterium]
MTGLNSRFGPSGSASRCRWQNLARRLLPLILCLAAGPASGDEPPVAEQTIRLVDARSMHGKVLCGYQGWFRCPGDGTGEGWLHWSRDTRRLTPRSVAVEMWPDLSEYGPEERHAAPGFTGPGGNPAELFSSAHPATVARHFQWLRQHEIDGVFVQRFLVNLNKPSFDTVLEHVRTSARQTGRVYAVCYDLTGAPPEQLVEMLVRDWKRLVDEKRLTQDDRYLHHGGRPVLMVWGFFSERFPAAIAHELIDFLKSDGPYGVTLVGGCEWPWRQVRDEGWARALRRFDLISPWNVGNYEVKDGRKVAATGSWAGDLAEARRHGMQLLPVVYPGFGWTNLKGPAASQATIPRRRGEFYREQFAQVSALGLDMAYVAMFDELDEATAIIPVSNSPPVEGRFETYEGLPADWYLRLTGDAARTLRGNLRD